MRKVNLIGKRYGRLLVLSEDPIRVNTKIRWLCRCDCGQETKVTGNSLSKGVSRSCGCLRSEKCRTNIITRNINMRGKDHPRWNHEISDEERQNGRFDDRYSNWRQKVYVRDNFKCKMCGGSPSNYLVAHHLDGWYWCKDRRYDVENGITLCRYCHDKFHSIYGYTENTAEEFFQYYLTRNIR